MKRSRKVGLQSRAAVASDAAAQLARILALIPRVADGREHKLAAIGAVVGADAATVLRDLESVAQRFDEPGGFVEGLQIMIGPDLVSVRTDHFLRPMRLTVPELHALDLGLTMLYAERPPDEARVIEEARTAIRKLVARLPADAASESGVHALASQAGGSELMAAIREGLRNRAKLRIHYWRGSANEADSRTVWPYRLVFTNGVWYLIAYCERSADVRIFRVDRIEHADLLADRFDPPADSAIAHYVADGKAFLSDTPARLRVRYSPKIVRWIAERERGTYEPDGSFIVDHPLADPEWAIRHVLQYGPDAEVIAPESVRNSLRRRLEGMLG